MQYDDWLESAALCPVFQGVDPGVLKLLLSDLHVQIRQYRTDDLIASQGDRVERMMILLTGSVRGEMTDHAGHLVKIEDIEAPRPIAGAFLFGKENIYPVHVLANTEVRLLTLSRTDFLELLRKSPEILTNYLNLLSGRSQFLAKKIQLLSLKSIRAKIAHYLLELRRDDASVIRIPESQQSIADLFGVARPSVARAFKQLEDEGILVLKNRVVSIQDPEALVGILNE